MASEDCLNGTIILSKDDVLTAVADYIENTFGDAFEVYAFREVLTGENKGKFEAEWREV